MIPITGTIITYNEEDHIQNCIASLLQVCEEVVVIDSLSTDRTVALAEQAGARVIQQEYRGEGRQRNFAERQAGNDWILALDADERMDDEMRRAVKSLSLDDPDTAYVFKRKSFVAGRWLKGPGFYPDWVTRLYNRTRAAYELRPGHARVKAPRMERLPGHILHYTYDDISDWIAKINWFTSRDAQGMLDAGRPASRFRPLWRAMAAGCRELILRRGIFSGMDGWTIAITSMFRSYMKYLKLNELHDRNSRTAKTDFKKLRDRSFRN